MKFKYEFSREKITERRKALKMTQKDLAEASGVDRGNISRIESGGRKHPQADVLGRLASALQVTPNYFFPNFEGDQSRRIAQ